MDQLNTGLQATAALIQSLLGEIRDNSIALSAFNADLKNIRETVSLLSRILKDAEGGNSVLTRLSIAENEIEGLEEKTKEIRDKLATAEKDLVEKITILSTAVDETRIEEKKDHRERKGQRLQFWGTIIPAILALTASLLTLILK